MAYSGYLTYDGIEIINVARTEHYARHLPWFKPVYRPAQLQEMLGQTYTDPFNDMPEWVDPDYAESLGFYGVYPLNWTGFEDSTRETDVTEFITEGGNPGRIRLGTRSMVISAVLLGEDECSVEYGFGWLKRALMGQNCAPTTAQGCFGRSLAFYRCEPAYDPTTLPPIPNHDERASAVLSGGDAEAPGAMLLSGGDATGPGTDCVLVGGTAVYVADHYLPPYPCPFEDPDPPTPRPGQTAEECLERFARSFRNVAITQGPSITAKRTTTSGGAVWTIQFTIVAGNPNQFTDPVLAINQFPNVLLPYPPAYPGTQDRFGEEYTEPLCLSEASDPYYNPFCPALTSPPPPPNIPVGCLNIPETWWRRWVTIDKALIPKWSEALPYVLIEADSVDIQTLRLRFFQGDVPGDCDYVLEYVISYIPAGQSLIIDAASKAVYIVNPDGSLRRADSLVSGMDGLPIDWSGLSCGDGIVMAMDTLTWTVNPSVTVHLNSRVNG